MIRKFMNMINRIAEKENEPEVEHSRGDLLKWAAGYILEGLPDDFYIAGVNYTRKEETQDISIDLN